MGKLAKNHWARLLTLVAATYQLAASIECFIWPKVFWDFTTKNFDVVAKPIPILQTVNAFLSLLCLAWEWPLKPLAKMKWHASIEARLLIYPISIIASVLMYQGTNAALFYLISVSIWFWARWDEEIVCPVPWTVPDRRPPPRRGEIYTMYQP
jgi:hypothetical protein